jgi:ferric-dicitrate binding protein FerR (iron transport regulator)
MSEINVCQEVDDAIVDVLDGTAPAALFDHIAECDVCRDKKHDAQRAAELVGGAGGDFHAPEGWEARLLAAIDERAGHSSSGPQPIASASHAQGAIVTRLDEGLADDAAALRDAPGTERMTATASSDAAVTAPSMDRVDPHAKTQAMAAYADETDPGVAPHVDAAAARGTAPLESDAARTGSPRAASSSSGVAAANTGNPSSGAAQQSREVHAVPAPRPAAPSSSKPPRGVRRGAFAASALVAVAAAAAFGFYLKGRPGSPDAPDAKAPWTGSVAAVSRAAADKTGGLELCDAKGACAPTAEGGAVAAGSVLKTDARTRARVKLADGTEVSIDRASVLELGKQARTATLRVGSVVADVAHLEGPAAHLRFPGGDIEILGTKLAVTANEEHASIEVARGEVRVASGSSKPVSIRAGEEGTILRRGEITVASSSTLADTMDWSDKSAEEVDAPVLRGIGELRARKPGETKEKEHAVRLAKHAAKVRVVDLVARTEIDETFTNDTDEQLEGIFRFPLPPGAQIERLALEVDGKLVDGAFVDRDRGAAIWRGAIQNAAPHAPKPKEEIVWVPGPWHDPALLEWQRGGRFELKIFPIPKKGSRRVVLAYTQTVEQSAGVRRFTLPLAHDASGTTKIGAFDLDLQVLGADKAVGVTTRGYDLASATGGEGERRTMHAVDFVPSGDLTVEYALPDRDKEVTAWAYAPSASDAQEFATAPGAPAKPASSAKKSAEVQAADEAAASILADKSAYVALAIRPKLPRWKEAKERVHAIVVDASRSMFGERFARATHLASSIVREMDRRDSFVLLACDTTCKPMKENGVPEAPGASAADEVERFLAQIEPDGGSDLSASVRAARAAAGPLGSKELRVVYLGDGTPTVGPTRPGHLEAAVRAALPGDDAAVIAVALGADADTTSLDALARGGGGVMVPYVPGQRVASAARGVLAAAYGEVLREPVVELPAGLSQVTPSRLDPIRAGGEAIVVARMSGADLSGTVKLRGKVAGERFEQTYPIKVLASTKAGNAFVPRLFAAAKIAELDRDGGEAAKPVSIALSRTFHVASRFTSLLVLESETMFKAFGLERAPDSGDAFTGEDAADSSSADGEVAVAGDSGVDELEKAKDDSPARRPAAHARASGGKAADLGASGGGFEARDGAHVQDKSAQKQGKLAANEPPPPPAAAPAAPKPSFAGPAGASAAASAAPEADFKNKVEEKKEMQQPAQTKTPAKKAAPADVDDAWTRREAERARNARRAGMVPMRKVFDRKVSFDAGNTLATQGAGKLVAAEAALRAAPDSRDKTVDLFALYSTSGRLGEAQELTARWSGRDALDPDALLARADLAARQGNRDRAVRILGGLVDVRPNDRAAQTRLAELHEAAGEAELACESRVTISEIAASDAKALADAVRCSRATQMTDLAARLLGDATPTTNAAAERLLVENKPAPPLAGDVQITAEWTGVEDVDVALVDAQGRRTSWLGTPVKNATVTSRDVKSSSRESLAIANLPQGSYVLEVSRASGGDAGVPVRGDVTLHIAGQIRKMPFALTGARTEIGTVRVFFTSRLVPVDQPRGWRR